MAWLVDAAQLTTRLGKALVSGRVPNYVIAFVTGHCNMSCAFCCPASRSIRDADELDPDQWGRALSGCDALVHLTVTGGEPFLRDDLLDVVSSMVGSSGVPRLSINTNGYFTGRIFATLETLLRRFPGVDTCLAISLDGPRAVHDALRGMPGAFTRARSTIDEVDRLRSRYPRLTVRLTSVLQPDNADVLGPFLEETALWPVDFHELALIRDVPIEVQRQVVEAYRRLTAVQLRRASRRYLQTMDWRLARQLRQDVLDQTAEGARPFGCLAGGRMIEVMADGTVRGCEMEKMRPHSNLGRVGGDAHTIVDLLAGEPARRFRRRAASCHCTFECALTCKTVFTPRAWPRLWMPRRFGPEQEDR